MNRTQYSKAVTSCTNYLSLGALWPSLSCAEKWCATHHGMQIGGNATEAAFDALRAFGLTVEEIQNNAGMR